MLRAMDINETLKAIANPMRRDILSWLGDPHRYFAHQTVGALDQDGVCVSRIQEKAQLSQSTVSQYLSTLQKAGLITSKRLGQWTYYQRDDVAIQRFLDQLAQQL